MDDAKDEQGRNERLSGSDDLTGRVIDGRYRVLERIGDGGMGAVYVAEQLTLRKKVAIKLVHAAFAGNGEMRARFAREAMATAHLEHPHICSALDFGELPDGGAYLVMQYVRGASLGDVMDEGPIPWPRACAIASQIADALAAAHAAGIVHRDLKPENVMIERRDDGTDLVKVLDFGVARVPGTPSVAPPGADTGKVLTRAGMVIGSPGYMPPEQALGDRVDHRADTYALGVILWEMITGRRLFEADTLSATLHRQMTEPVPKLRATVPDPTIPVALDELVAALLPRERHDRVVDAAAARDLLGQMAMRASLEGRAEGTPLGVMLPLAVGRTSVGTKVPGPSRARLVAIGAGILVALGLAAYGGALWAGRSAAPQPAAAEASDGAAEATSNTRGAEAAPAEVAAQADPPVAAPAAEDEPPGSAPAPEPTPAPAEVAPVAEPAVGVASGRMPVPDALVGEVDRLLRGDGGPGTRRAAAEAILGFADPTIVPAYARAIASYELSVSCRGKIDALEQIGATGDPRALPFVARLRALPRTGCGFRGRRDCHSCIRGALGEVHRALLAAAAGGS